MGEEAFDGSDYSGKEVEGSQRYRMFSNMRSGEAYCKGFNAYIEYAHNEGKTVICSLTPFLVLLPANVFSRLLKGLCMRSP